jgi:hypothetical protein
MANKRSPQERPQVTLPEAGGDQPRFGQIGVIAGVCFAIGIAWPFLAGVQLVPRAPIDESDREETAAETPEKPEPKQTADEDEADEPQRTTEQTVQVEKTVVIHCLDSKGGKLKTCDKPALDDSFTPKIQALANCPEAKNLSGVLSLGFRVDFKNDKIKELVKGKTTSLKNQVSTALLNCAETEFKTTSLKGIDHEHPEYLIFYVARFLPPGTAIAPPQADTEQAVTPVSGTATIAFESAMIRDSAERDAKVKARLLYGTRVFVTGKVGEWYEVKYDSKGRKGWVHKNAIGMD